MDDSDPRPMPPEVLRAYHDPVDLRGLLMSSVYSEQDRRDVLEALMRSLIAKHGDVWIEAGSKEVRVSTRVKQTKKNVANAIELLATVEEYGGSDGVLPLLAQTMQPRWARWWESFEWTSWGGINDWGLVAGNVLGQRQIAWLASQCARTAIGRTMPQDRSACMNAIEAAEAWAVAPSEANRTNARYAADAARSRSATVPRAAGGDYAENDANASARAAADSAVDAARVAWTASYSFSHYADAVDNAAYAVIGVASAASYARLCELTRRLITPTLVTSASRSSGETRAHSSRA